VVEDSKETFEKDGYLVVDNEDLTDNSLISELPRFLPQNSIIASGIMENITMSQDKHRTICTE